MALAFPMEWWTDPTSKHAFWLSWISVVITLVSATGGLSVYSTTGSPLILAYGLENCVDFLSSIVVVWRFYCPRGLTEERDAKLRRREERASIAISIIIGILGIFVGSAALYGFSRGPEDPEGYLFFFSILSILVFGALAVVKFKYAKDLQSPSLYKDGICSFIGTFLSTALFFTTTIIETSPEFWYLDPVVSCLVALAAIYIGFSDVIKMLHNGIPLYKIGWWRHGTVEDETGKSVDGVEITDSQQRSEEGHYQNADSTLPIKEEEDDQTNPEVV